MTYPRHRDESSVPPNPSLPMIEQSVLEYWEADKTFRATIDARPVDEEFVFYDGPPFANGLPHYGHLLTGFVKDVVPRYQTMRGRRVERRFGWDCHGLPAEVGAEQELGITSKREIVDLGVEEFNQVCRTSVLRYTDEWQHYVNRQARWVDFDNDYKTLDLNYMESVLWAFKALHEKGLVYEGFRVMPYCWRCETPLSNSEIRLDDTYRDRTDPTATVWFQLETGERALAWTTMPWTLVPNTNLVVHPDVEYAVVRATDGERYVLAEARLQEYAEELGIGAGAERLDTVRGSELVGRRYTPIFDFLNERMTGVPAAYTVLSADFVTTEDGTGIVQVAPSHGEDDFNVCTAAGVPVVLTVDDHTRFTSIAPRFEGLQVFEANKPLLAELRERGVLFKQNSYTHPYPHCWRCDTPLVYKALSSWFVQTTALRDRMLQLNEQITWVPEHVKHGSFGKWLENVRDWGISRNRFWGSPIPVWKSDDPQYPRVDVYGSLDELERDFGPHGHGRPTDLHRPYVDNLTRPNPDDPTGRSTMRRVPEVLDCWFESGSMPFAQVHYPFENAEWFESHFPGDFIVEYIGQSRAWFYNLHVLATALFDRPAFETCVTHGVVLGDDGRKASKRLRNFPDPVAMFDTYGADAVRWSLMSSPLVRGGEGPVAESGIRDSARQAILPLWNAYSFLVLYTNVEQAEARWRTDSQHVLDRYVLAKLHEHVAAVTDALDGYDIQAACAATRSFLDVLTNWYVRRSRDRFWAGDTEAFDTLFTVLEVLARTTAPLLPMVTEEVWRGLTGERSVHLTDWPRPETLPYDPDLVSAMDSVRAVCSSSLALRKSAGLRVRLPLASLTVAAPNAQRLRPYADLIRDEVNVKEVVLDTKVDAHCEQVLSVIPRAAGPRLGSDVQRVIRAVKDGDWRVDGQTVVAGGVPLVEGEYELKLVPSSGSGAAAQLPGGEGVVVLDTEVPPALAAEGLARDVIRVVQQARRAAGLEVSDRIRLVVDTDADTRAALDANLELVTAETLTTDFAYGSVDAEPAAVGDDATVRVRVSRVASSTD